MIQLSIYTKEGCCLCESARAVIEKVRIDYPMLKINEIDVSSNTELNEKFQYEIPVVFIENEKIFKYKVDEKLLRKKLNQTLQKGA